MMFTWTMLAARKKGLLPNADFFGFLLFCSIVIDAGICAVLLVKFGGRL